MRVVIDLQAAQSTGSRTRGIGRYSLSLALAMVRNRGSHEIFIALNGLFPDTIELVRAAFDGLLPQENIRVWNTVGPVSNMHAANDWRRCAAELARESFLASLRPDVLHVSSLFEGLEDDAVSSIGLLSRTVPTAVTLYDLIPYIHPKPYLENPAVETWYHAKIEHLRHADLWLAISESTRREGISHLHLPENRSVNISTDAESQFRQLSISAELEQPLRQKYGLHRPFVMYTGGIDHRKNIEGLIRAYALLPSDLRKVNQLAIVCAVALESRHLLEQLTAQQGLGKDEVILTGFVPDDDLVALYNLCALFVFPSWHEGFGLPALEAMRCGAPVIGANTSSLPEVIGWDEALFDPHSANAIATAIERALTDPSYRQALVSHGELQAQRFSWDESARRAIAAMEDLHAERMTMPAQLPLERRPRMAYVSPLPPERSGIADYSAELLPELGRFYEIDVIVAQHTISDPWVNEKCVCRSVQWFIENSDRYDRVLYHFGNSVFHGYMFELLKAIPGVVVMHDFFLSGVAAHMDVHGHSPGHWAQELYKSHGYTPFRDRSHTKDMADVVLDYPCSLSVVQDSLGIIVHSRNSLRLASRWYGGDTGDWVVIPHLRNPRVCLERERARQFLGFSRDDFMVCAFGILGPTKLNHRLLNAWIDSRLGRNMSCYLVFVGENHAGDYGNELLETVRSSRLAGRIRITGWAAPEVFRQYLAAADIGVQLRTLSRGETSGTVLDCMNCSLATIINANGSMADLADEAVWKLPDEFTDEQLIEALETLWEHPARRYELGARAREIVLDQHSPETCAKQYRDVIESFYRAANTSLLGLYRAVAQIPGNPSDGDLIQLADALAKNNPPRNSQRQLLVDVSELVQTNAKTGIRHVVRSVLSEWLADPRAGFRVEPVYATECDGYRYARNFTLDFLGCAQDWLPDDPIDYMPGDIFFALDLQPRVQLAQRAFYQTLRRQGVQVKFMVYDLLCVTMPQFFVHGAEEGLHQWLTLIAESDGAVCISRAVADELKKWLKKKAPVRQRALDIDWFHQGAEVDNSSPTKGLPKRASVVLSWLVSRPSFLMVDTLEPRKGHAQVLDGFEYLWRTGVDANLLIVGNQGLMVANLSARLRAHPELNKRLIWLDGISDDYLEAIYTASTCLIAASYGEGFGLPLIEAAQHKLPIIARDIPVYREVAGEHAYYFDATAADGLAQAIKDWLRLYREGKHPKSEDMPWLTWRESAQRLREILLGTQ